MDQHTARISRHIHMESKKGMRWLLRDTHFSTWVCEHKIALRSPTISPFRRGNAAQSGALDQCDALCLLIYTYKSIRFASSTIQWLAVSTHTNQPKHSARERNFRFLAKNAPPPSSTPARRVNKKSVVYAVGIF